MRLVSIAVALVAAGALHAASGSGVYLSRDAFLARAFPDGTPAPRVLWLDAGLRAALTEVLDHAPDALRVRYWTRDARSAWILDEIGKEKPITLGVVVDAGAIESLEVLEFRESRGWEIRHPFFTRQFERARLGPDGGLDRRIDGITGATLSVRAATRVAEAALLLDAHRRETGGEPGPVAR